MAKTRPALFANQLLALLPNSEQQRLLPKLEPVALAFRAVLVRALAPLDYAYFPNHGVISIVSHMQDGTGIEVATIGREGMVGTTVMLGVNAIPAQAIVQVPGEALRMSAATLRAEVVRDCPLRQLLLLYQAAYLAQVSQGVACNGLHPVRQRCCRWLLMTHDRVHDDDFPMTHEFLAEMLGVRRSSVTEVLRPLQNKRLIRYSRGRITILDRSGLEAAACECYHSVKDEFARVFG